MAGALIRRTKDELKRRIPNGRGFAATSNAVIIHDTGGFYPNAGACRVMMHSANHRLASTIFWAILHLFASQSPKNEANISTSRQSGG